MQIHQEIQLKLLSLEPQGIGLCRTEHMFFDADRIMAVREMIVSKTEEQRRKALAKLLPMQREDSLEFMEELEERPATIRS